MTATHPPADRTDIEQPEQTWTYWAGRFVAMTAALTVAYALTFQLELMWLITGEADPYANGLVEVVVVSLIPAALTALGAVLAYRYVVGRVSIRGVDLTVPVAYLVAPIVFILALFVYVLTLGDGIPSQTLAEHAEEFGEFFAFWYVGTLLPALTVAAVYTAWSRRISMTLPRAVSLALVVLLVLGGGQVAATEVGLTGDDTEDDVGLSHEYHSEPGAFSPARGALACSDRQTLDPEFATHNHSLPEYDVTAVHEVREDIWVAPRLEVNETSGEATQEGWYFELRIDGEQPSDEDVIHRSVYDSSPYSKYPPLWYDGRNWLHFGGDESYSIAWDVINDDGEIHRYVTRLCAPE